MLRIGTRRYLYEWPHGEEATAWWRALEPGSSGRWTPASVLRGRLHHPLSNSSSGCLADGAHETTKPGMRPYFVKCSIVFKSLPLGNGISQLLRVIQTPPSFPLPGSGVSWFIIQLICALDLSLCNSAFAPTKYKSSPRACHWAKQSPERIFSVTDTSTCATRMRMSG